MSLNGPIALICITDSPFAIAHVPEIRMAALEFGLCPWKPNAMVMLVVGWIIVRHQPA